MFRYAVPSWSASNSGVHCLAESATGRDKSRVVRGRIGQVEQLFVAARGDAAREAGERRHLRHDVGHAFAWFGRRSVDVSGGDRSFEAAECRGDAHREDVEIDRHHGMADRGESYWAEIRRRRLDRPCSANGGPARTVRTAQRMAAARIRRNFIEGCRIECDKALGIARTPSA